MGDASCNSDGDLNLLSANRNDNGCNLNAFNDNPDNRWNRENGFAFSVEQLTSFLLRNFFGGVLLLKLAIPAARHSADLFKR